jgi:alpha-glucosidase
MIEFIKKMDGILVVYNNEVLIDHVVEKPAFYVGNGVETIDSYRGNYQIKDYVEERIGLEQYEVHVDSIVFYHNQHFVRLTFEEKDNRLHISIHRSNTSNRLWIRLSAIEEEKIYGLGEQPSYFNVRGRNYPLWTSEPGVGRDKSTMTTYLADLHDKAGGDYYNTYYPEPTFVSTRKYWFHASSFGYSEFNFSQPHFHELMFFDTPKELIYSFRSNYLELVEDLTNYTGRVPRLPEYLLDGIVLGVQGGMLPVLQYLQLALDYDIKVSGLWCQDWAGYRYTSFGKRLFWNWVLNEEVYPLLKEEIKKLNQNNIQFLAYICPFLLENQSLFEEAKDLGYLVLNQDHEVYRIDFGEFNSGAVDLTNPKAFEWYKNIIKTNLIDLGITGWMADFGEYLPVDAILHNKKSGKVMHNQWPVLWAKCNYEAVKEAGKLGEIFYFMRSGGHGSQHYATALWAGDQSVNWETHDGIPSVIPSALSSGIIGNPFTTSDIGGYTSLHGNIRTKELFDRWLEMNVFTSYMRTHEGNRPKENFQFYHDQDTLKLMSRMTNLRVDLKPYISHLFDEATMYGYPVQRPLFMHYEADALAYDIQYSYLFGKDVLIDPVIQQGQVQKAVYLPKDNWIHLFTGTKYSGNQTIQVEAPIGFPPVFYRETSDYRDLFEQITKKYQMGGANT